jgi:hypothetical protein
MKTTAYRDAFASRVRDGGIEGLIKSLSDKNRQGDACFQSHRNENADTVNARSALQNVK